ncbi:MAG: LysM peptidoglycan-binding domain-containing protein [Desulfuromonadales bacterium]|nr:LysM peptidoglycan-binding domain-containing protein [Desulfuromonadales bacterium]MBN2792129.1 LysM peptidoglycan-binding domain-containing protein [Desulfuromonadales bacterium]
MFKYISVLIFSILLAACQPATPKISLVAPEHSSSMQSAVTKNTQQKSDLNAQTAVAETPLKDRYQLPLESSLLPEIRRFLDPESSPLHYAGDFPMSNHPRVERLIERYSGSQKATFGRWLERAGRYIPKIQMVFASEGLPLDLAYLAMIESGFNVRAYSWAHAAGPWQFIESTGRLYGLQNDWWQDGRLDLEKSTRAAARHLKYLYTRFDGDWYLAVAAYNAGGGKVRKAVKESGSRDFWTLTEGRVLREETRNYLPKLLAALTIVKDLEAYGFDQLTFDDPLEYDTVTVETTTDLDIIAGFAGVSYQQLKELNPELKRWCTPPGVKDYVLRVPLGSAGQVENLYAQLPRDQRASYHRHQIKKGDTLQVLARKYRIEVDDIIALNNIKNPRAIQIGTNLILPLKEGFTRLPVDELADSYVRSRRQTYKVRQGDSLWSIARRFDVSEKELRVWNRLGWSNFLKPGQVLAVSKPGARQVVKAEKPTGPTRKMVYKVLPGDTLWDIGRQFDVALEEIRRWNSLTQEHILQPGQTLTLMVSTSRQG